MIDKPADEPFDIFEGMPIVSRLRIVLAWAYETAEDNDDLMRGMQLAPYLVMGEISVFTKHDWFIFYDALGRFPKRDEVLDQIYDLADHGFDDTILADLGCLDPAYAEEWNAIYDDEFTDEDEADD